MEENHEKEQHFWKPCYELFYRYRGTLQNRGEEAEICSNKTGDSGRGICIQMGSWPGEPEAGRKWMWETLCEKFLWSVSDLCIWTTDGIWRMERTFYRGKEDFWGIGRSTEAFFQGWKDYIKRTWGIYGGRVCLWRTGDNASDEITGRKNHTERFSGRILVFCAGKYREIFFCKRACKILFL